MTIQPDYQVERGIITVASSLAESLQALVHCLEDRRTREQTGWSSRRPTGDPSLALAAETLARPRRPNPVNGRWTTEAALDVLDACADAFLALAERCEAADDTTPHEDRALLAARAALVQALWLQPGTERALREQIRRYRTRRRLQALKTIPWERLLGGGE